jgi:hypothetical protein
MAFTTPGTAVAGSVLTSAFWNTNVRDNIAQLGTGYTLVETVPFTVTAAFEKDDYPYLRAIRVKAQAGGGGGGGAGNNNSRGGGGGGGSYGEAFITDIAGLASSVTVTVGAGGAGGAAGNNNGIAGGSSSFGSLLVCGGGGLGINAQGASNLPNGGTVSTPGYLSIEGDDGWIRLGGGSFTINSLSAGGDSFMGYGGPAWAYVAGQDGRPGRGYGGGGGGGWRTDTNRAGGNGTAGILLLELYA